MADCSNILQVVEMALGNVKESYYSLKVAGREKKIIRERVFA